MHEEKCMMSKKKSNDYYVSSVLCTLFATTVISWNVSVLFSEASTFPVYFNRIHADTCISIKNIMESVYHILHPQKLK